MRIQDKNSKNLSEGNTSLTIHACAESGDLIGLRTLLRNDPSLLNERSIHMVQTPLHVAAGLNRVEIVKYLLDWGGPGKVELEAKNAYGETPLHAASKNGCNETIKMLLDSGANLEARTNNLMRPLHLAVGFALRSGDNSIVKTLTDYNPDCSAEDDVGMIPLNYIPAGLQNQELATILGHIFAAQIYSTMGYTFSGLEQSNYSIMDYSSTSYQDDEESRNYDSGIKGKMDEFDNELSEIVGLHELKLQLQKWAKGMLLDEKRRAMGLDLGPRKPPHMAFLGNPGTGKTTVARILGKLLHSVGVLSSDDVTEVQRTDLVGEYLGQTGPKTRKKIEEAMGGILFVDEAYRLAPKQSAGDYTDYGVEALEEIMSVLEDGDFVVVFAGYTEPMKRVFSSNEGFCRRVTHFFEFDDFTCKDLAEMLMIKMSKQNEKSRLYGFKLHPSCTYDAILAVIERNSTEKLRNKMNGGLVDHMLNNARECLDLRLTFDSKGDELLTITLSDLEAGLRLLSQRVNID
ncbi:26S proteasome regulatory complex, subunit PSMD10 [Handroanthus impetiginosus]|uniref:26S proteasome regulatory complex, subunit PSMD10 n=1 Tax=Handroanthus impetiginosus TaxID=429701 RepID=A0A2G9H828_9LAMI|nr:26S proteasome regulatory complex, subunit PSMD10 [Handroanthus impetiginosus]